MAEEAWAEGRAVSVKDKVVSRESMGMSQEGTMKSSESWKDWAVERAASMAVQKAQAHGSSLVMKNLPVPGSRSSLAVDNIFFDVKNPTYNNPFS